MNSEWKQSLAVIEFGWHLDHVSIPNDTFPDSTLLKNIIWRNTLIQWAKQTDIDLSDVVVSICSAIDLIFFSITLMDFCVGPLCLRTWPGKMLSSLVLSNTDFPETVVVKFVDNCLLDFCRSQWSTGFITIYITGNPTAAGVKLSILLMAWYKIWLYVVELAVHIVLCLLQLALFTWSCLSDLTFNNEFDSWKRD